MDEFEEILRKARIRRINKQYGIDDEDFVDAVCHPEKFIAEAMQSKANAERLEDMNCMIKKDVKKVKYLGRRLDEIIYGKEGYFSQCYNLVKRIFRG